MKFLVDVNVLLAAVWDTHPQHKQAFNWVDGKKILLCTRVGLKLATMDKGIKHATVVQI